MSTQPPSRTGFYLDKKNGQVMGVCAGLADYTGVDVLLFRLGLIAGTLITGPVVPLFYVLTGWLANEKR